MKVIKYGRKRRETCKNCGAVLEYEKEDVKTVQTGMNEFDQQIKCPICGRTISVGYRMMEGRENDT